MVEFDNPVNSLSCLDNNESRSSGTGEKLRFEWVPPEGERHGIGDPGSGVVGANPVIGDNALSGLVATLCMALVSGNSNAAFSASELRSFVLQTGEFGLARIAGNSKGGVRTVLRSLGVGDVGDSVGKKPSI